MHSQAVIISKKKFAHNSTFSSLKFVQLLLRTERLDCILLQYITETLKLAILY